MIKKKPIVKVTILANFSVTFSDIFTLLCQCFPSSQTKALYLLHRCSGPLLLSALPCPETHIYMLSVNMTVYYMKTKSYNIYTLCLAYLM